ncbi:hypothetical protein [Mycobacterium talmoniae]|uniref:ESX-1 secretion-associated protein EspL n=1 Tax=Mycobacterium talmoniae TaxID=1858794 RepID=A0A1S1MUQ1_9MYCO|nr:hypothetical protein [Mycobacterium talmoniae]OHU90513.1 hypothetical protein BKN37_25570 [Mycobacterium talmoniae]
MTTPQFPIHPLVLQSLDLADAYVAQLDRYLDIRAKTTTTATDATKTVAVTLNDHGWFVDLWIKPGTARLGAATLAERLNEALATANRAAAETTTSIDGDCQQVMEALKAQAAALDEQLALGPQATYYTPPPAQTASATDDDLW